MMIVVCCSVPWMIVTRRMFIRFSLVILWLTTLKAVTIFTLNVQRFLLRLSTIFVNLVAGAGYECFLSI